MQANTKFLGDTQSFCKQRQSFLVEWANVILQGMRTPNISVGYATLRKSVEIYFPDLFPSP